MRTEDLFGQPPGELVRQFDRRAFRAALDIRVVDMRGEPLGPESTPGNPRPLNDKWRSYTIPPKAVLALTREGRIDRGSWSLQLTLDAEAVARALPRGVTIERYFRIEVNYLAGGTWPYFRGIIDQVRDGWARQTGSRVRTIELECFDELQRCKGVPIPALQPLISTAPYSGRLTGIVSTQRMSRYLDTDGTEFAPGAATFNVAGGGLRIFKTDAFDPAQEWVRGQDFTVSTADLETDGSAKITWLVPPPAVRHFQWQQIEHFGVPMWAGWPPPAFLVLPFGRDPRDLYQTTVVALDPDAKTVTPADRVSYSSHNPLLDVTLPEVAVFTLASGAQASVPIVSFDPDGTVHLASWPWWLEGEGLAMRLGTTELFPVWWDMGWKPGNQNGLPVYFYRDAAMTQQYPRRVFQAMSNQGLATVARFDFPQGSEVYARLELSDTDTNFPQPARNSPESFIRELVGTNQYGLQLYRYVGIQKTYGLMKNFEVWDKTLDEVLKFVKQNFLPPNAYIHGEPDGAITVKLYKQKLVPDFELADSVSITRTGRPEPITAVLVVSTDTQRRNMAPQYFRGDQSAGWDKQSPLVDNRASVVALQADAGVPAKAVFQVPADTPIEVFPTLAEVKVNGFGYLSAQWNGSVRYAQVPGVTRVRIGSADGKPAAYTIPLEALIRGRIACGDIAQPATLTLTFEADDGAAEPIPAQCAEVEIWTETHGAWRAEFSSDPAKTPQGEGTFGPAWTQPDPLQRVSYRGAPDDFLRRVSPLYDLSPARANKPRLEKIRRPGITAHECRDYAERYADELIRIQETYTVVAVFDPRLELGDTGRVRMGDGTNRLLMLWGQCEQFDGRTILCTYEFVDYGA